ncbi:Hemoglobin and hemoglobin-haptoglobin-binding protein A precursor, partial [Haemophilus influenzae]
NVKMFPLLMKIILLRHFGIRSS